VNLAEVVVHEVQRDGVLVVLQLLRLGIGQPGERRMCILIVRFWRSACRPFSAAWIFKRAGVRDILRFAFFIFHFSLFRLQSSVPASESNEK
jgi:hypothetical protein